jgi:hypothetical protein
MALHYNRRAIFHSFCRGLLDKYIPNVIDLGFEAPILTKTDDPRTNLFFFFRRTGYGIQAIEKIPQALWLELRYSHWASVLFMQI